MVRHSVRVRLQPRSSVDGPIAAPSPVHGRPVQRSIRLPAMFVHADLRSLLPQPFLPVAVFIAQIEYSFSIVAAMLHAVRTEEDVDKLVMRLILLNAPKARVGKNIFFCWLQIAFSLQAFVWVVIMMCYHANMADVPEVRCQKKAFDVKGSSPLKPLRGILLCGVLLWRLQPDAKHAVWFDLCCSSGYQIWNWKQEDL